MTRRISTVTTAPSNSLVQVLWAASIHFLLWGSNFNISLSGRVQSQQVDLFSPNTFDFHFLHCKGKTAHSTHCIFYFSIIISQIYIYNEANLSLDSSKDLNSCQNRCDSKKTYSICCCVHFVLITIAQQLPFSQFLWSEGIIMLRVARPQQNFHTKRRTTKLSLRLCGKQGHCGARAFLMHRLITLPSS